METIKAQVDKGTDGVFPPPAGIAPLARGDLWQHIPSCRCIFLYVGLPMQGQCNSSYPTAQAHLSITFSASSGKETGNSSLSRNCNPNGCSPSCNSSLVAGEEETHGDHAAGRASILHPQTGCPSGCQSLATLLIINLRF